MCFQLFLSSKLGLIITVYKSYWYLTDNCLILLQVITVQFKFSNLALWLQNLGWFISLIIFLKYFTIVSEGHGTVNVFHPIGYSVEVHCLSYNLLLNLRTNLRISATNLANGSSHVYILITLIPEMISFITLILSSVKTAVLDLKGNKL